jgi:glycosyltransferase involved in cell wall biosynthesis
MKISAVIPAYNEAGSIARVVHGIDRSLVGEIIVVDNGSVDGTGDIAEKAGAKVVRETRLGYGWACLAGIDAADNPDIIVFLDADYSDYPEKIADIVKPIIENRAAMVIGSRVPEQAEKGALTIPQKYGNWLASILLNKIFGTRYTDLGPFRAIRYSTLKALGMKDKKYGWTIEMQIKAAILKIPVVEVPVPYRKRAAGKSKVSGTLKGVVLASVYILYYIFNGAIKKITGSYR